MTIGHWILRTGTLGRSPQYGHVVGEVLPSFVSSSIDTQVGLYDVETIPCIKPL